jgi:hypothetical protein
MRARVTFLEKAIFNFGGGHLAYNANVQGCLERSGWTLGFKADIQLTDLVFEGTVEWLIEPKGEKLLTGTKFQYVNPGTGAPFALGVVL